jgi:YgiT-type zinc finger domain-containing protein
MAAKEKRPKRPTDEDAPTDEPTMCDLCGKEGVKVRRVARSFGKGNSVFVIDDIPLIECPHCGKNYFAVETLRKIERIKADHQGKS